MSDKSRSKEQIFGIKKNVYKMSTNIIQINTYNLHIIIHHIIIIKRN